MDYIAVKGAAEKWNVSTRSITDHLVDGRIPGAVIKGNLLLIPTAAEKPVDLRRGKKKH